MKPIGVSCAKFIQYRMPDGTIKGLSCAPWIPVFCAELAVRLQRCHQLYLAFKYGHVWQRWWWKSMMKKDNEDGK